MPLLLIDLLRFFLLAVSIPGFGVHISLKPLHSDLNSVWSNFNKALKSAFDFAARVCIISL